MPTVEKILNDVVRFATDIVRFSNLLPTTLEEDLGIKFLKNYLSKLPTLKENNTEANFGNPLN